MRIGVEVGGTFTDLVWEHDGKIDVIKVSSTPAQPDQGALTAIERSGVNLAELNDLVHGSTVATNAILERKGARLALIVSSGTRDILLLQRHNRQRIYDLHYRKPEPVVRRRDTFEVTERLDANGDVIEPLDLIFTEQHLLDYLSGKDYDAVAICLLNSYVNPVHEQQLAQLIQQNFPDLTVSCSHQVNREFREYERCSTTTLSAYVQPVMAYYLNRFEESLHSRGYQGTFSVMQSNGGRLPAEAIARNAISALFSGPAAGIVGAIAAAGRSGYSNLITFDMGGTSTDVCLIEAGKPVLTGMVEIDGLPIKTSVIDMVTIGAGGGSIVWIDDGGMLRVGPQSAGADPGPACYARGGTQATITDAHIVRGTLQVDSLLGGEMAADAAAARRVFEPIAQQLGLSAEMAADSAIQLAEANIVRAIQRISTERGHDPRNYVLVPYGGAGPMLAARLAEDLQIDTIVVPPNAGVLSAYGLLASDYIHYETRTQRLLANASNLPAIRSTLQELATTVTNKLDCLGLTGTAKLNFSLEMRYVGQAFEIAVPLADNAHQQLSIDELLAAFRNAHQRVFEFDKGKHGQCEVVSFRVGGAIPPPVLPTFGKRQDQGNQGTARPLTVLEHGEKKQGQRWQRQHLSQQVLPGPALVEDKTSTLYLPESWQLNVDEHSNLILHKTEG